ncbi:MAG: hypothetical protein F6K47_17940 [Symploca sp. SIO2E6]|nr:hypothetical protein [Symploca sp. SIO2E6]
MNQRLRLNIEESQLNLFLHQEDAELRELTELSIAQALSRTPTSLRSRGS